MAGQILNPGAFPPGSSAVFIDLINRLSRLLDNTTGTATGAEQLAKEAVEAAQTAAAAAAAAQGTAAAAQGTADAAQGTADAAQAVNTLQDITIDDHEDRLDALDVALAALDARVTALESWQAYTTRQKSEVVYTGISVVIPTTGANLLTLLATLTPTSGTLLPFFNVTDGRLHGLNKNLNLNLKISIRGSFAGGSSNRSMQLTFSTVVPDTIVISRNAATTDDDLLFSTFFSVEEGDDIATGGITMTAQANGSAFTVTQIKLIATQ